MSSPMRSKSRTGITPSPAPKAAASSSSSSSSVAVSSPSKQRSPTKIRPAVPPPFVIEPNPPIPISKIALLWDKGVRAQRIQILSEFIKRHSKPSTCDMEYFDKTYGPSLPLLLFTRFSAHLRLSYALHDSDISIQVQALCIFVKLGQPFISRIVESGVVLTLLRVLNMYTEKSQQHTLYLQHLQSLHAKRKKQLETIQKQQEEAAKLIGRSGSFSSSFAKQESASPDMFASFSSFVSQAAQDDLIPEPPKAPVSVAPEDKRSTLILLIELTECGRTFKEFICDEQGINLLCSGLTMCDDSNKELYRTLCVHLFIGNPRFSPALQLGLMALLSRVPPAPAYAVVASNFAEADPALASFSSTMSLMSVSFSSSPPLGSSSAVLLSSSSSDFQQLNLISIPIATFIIDILLLCWSEIESRLLLDNHSSNGSLIVPSSVLQALESIHIQSLFDAAAYCDNQLQLRCLSALSKMEPHVLTECSAPMIADNVMRLLKTLMDFPTQDRGLYAGLAAMQFLYSAVRAELEKRKIDGAAARGDALTPHERPRGCIRHMISHSKIHLHVLRAMLCAHPDWPTVRSMPVDEKDLNNVTLTIKDNLAGASQIVRAEANFRDFSEAAKLESAAARTLAGLTEDQQIQLEAEHASMKNQIWSEAAYALRGLNSISSVPVEDDVFALLQGAEERTDQIEQIGTMFLDSKGFAIPEKVPIPVLLKIRKNYAVKFRASPSSVNK